MYNQENTRDSRIKNLTIQAIVCSSIALGSLYVLWIEPVQAQAVCTENLQVIRTRASEEFGSGWIDIKETNFKKGNKLTLRIGGTAEKILIRLLPIGTNSDEPIGIIEINNEPIFQVPESRVIELKLEKDHPSVIQISVHGGPRPWFYDLGDNGPATLLSASCK